MKIFTTGAAIVTLTLSAGAQGPRRPVEQIQKMQRLDYLLGEWRGDGWIEWGGRRSSFKSYERIDRKLSGAAYLIEGAHTTNIPEHGEVSVHEALGMLTYDEHRGGYLMRTHTRYGLRRQPRCHGC